jgi:hypothetical protein
MAYWVKRILLKGGEIVTERELRRDENLFRGPAPAVGDTLNVNCRGRTFDARVVWGNWPGRNEGRDPDIIVPIRVEEIG